MGPLLVEDDLLLLRGQRLEFVELPLLLLRFVERAVGVNGLLTLLEELIGELADLIHVLDAGKGFAFDVLHGVPVCVEVADLCLLALIGVDGGLKFAQAVPLGVGIGMEGVFGGGGVLVGFHRVQDALVTFGNAKQRLMASCAIEKALGVIGMKHGLKRALGAFCVLLKFWGHHARVREELLRGNDLGEVVVGLA